MQVQFSESLQQNNNFTKKKWNLKKKHKPKLLFKNHC